MRLVALNNKGLTLVEVMIALVILLLVFLALMQTALVSINANMTNVLRDEAVNIAEQRMNEARNIPFDTLANDGPVTVTRNIRNRPNFQYEVLRTVTPVDVNNRQIDIRVRWEWKEQTIANGNPYTHTISTILRRQ